MSRPMVLWIDPNVKRLDITFWRDYGDGVIEPGERVKMPVPPDNRLDRAVDRLTSEILLPPRGDFPELEHDAEIIRAAFYLDEEDDNG